MQRGSSSDSNQYTQRSVSKPVMLGLVTTVAVGIAVPLILPHVSHPSMIYHIALHIASVTIAAFLSIVSLLAYRRNPNARILLMTFGFMALGLVESIYLLDAAGITTVSLLEIPAVNIELTHIILLLMLTMFSLGVLKVDNK